MFPPQLEGGVELGERARHLVEQESEGLPRPRQVAVGGGAEGGGEPERVREVQGGAPAGGGEERGQAEGGRDQPEVRRERR